MLVLHDSKLGEVELFNEKARLAPFLEAKKKEGQSIGLVPTMGALHQGHLSLIERAYLQCDCVIVSIFVNPTQFDNPSDLRKYPQTLTADVALLQKKFAHVIIFSPSVEEMYGNSLAREHFDFGHLAQKMEGKYRDGHFDGVGTVLKKLFKIVQPHYAFFGEKDYQQLVIVKKLVHLLQLPIKIVGCPINREKNGLAQSSRNKRLSKQKQKEASFIYQTLQETKKLFGTIPVVELKKKMTEQFRENSVFHLEYFEIADTASLTSAKEIENGKKYRAFVAAYLNNVRLIDNIALN